MKYNFLGNTGLKVSELCLGTMTFGGKGYWTTIGELQQHSVDDIIKRSIDAGINLLIPLMSILKASQRNLQVKPLETWD